MCMVYILVNGLEQVMLEIKKKRYFSYEKAKAYAKKLNLNGNKEWTAHTKTESFPFNDIPRAPANVYSKNGEWEGWVEFF